MIEEQKQVLDSRREPACAELMEERKQKYRELLDHQRGERAEFRGRLQTGQDNSDFFHVLAEKRNSRESVRDAFLATGQELTHDHRQEQSRSPWYAEVEHDEGRSFHLPAGAAHILEAGPNKAVATVGSLLDSLFFDLTTLGSARPEPMSKEERADIGGSFGSS